MALTLRLTIGTPCAGGNHYTVTATPTPGAARTFEYSNAELDAPISAEEQEAFVRVLIRQYRRQLNGATRAQQKAAIEAKTLDLTVTVV